MLNKTLVELDAKTTKQELRTWYAYFGVLEKERQLEDLKQDAKNNLIKQNGKHVKF